MEIIYYYIKNMTKLQTHKNENLLKKMNAYHFLSTINTAVTYQVNRYVIIVIFVRPKRHWAIL